MYAITGITGKVGGWPARSCHVRNASKGEKWAALGCEVALANMEDGLALSDAFAGATATFILPPPLFDPEPGYPEARAVIDGVVEALTKARPAKVLCLSTIGADAVHDNLLSQRMMMERALRKLPLPLMILRPAWFIDNAASDLASECETGLIHTFLQPACKAFPMVAAKDVGRLAADLIQEAWIDTRVVELEGAARASPNDLARAFATVLERPVRVETVPRARAGSRSSVLRARKIRCLGSGCLTASTRAGSSSATAAGRRLKVRRRSTASSPNSSRRAGPRQPPDAAAHAMTCRLPAALKGERACLPTRNARREHHGERRSRRRVLRFPASASAPSGCREPMPSRSSRVRSRSPRTSFMSN
jgi:NAD(P)H dehydrogenase (quinone)